MKRIITLITIVCAFCAVPKYSSAQFELGFQGGLSHYQGDLVDKPMQFKGSQLGVGVFGRYYFGRYFAGRLGFNYGKVEHADSYYPEDNDRVRRNLHFESTIMDFSLALQVSISSFFNKDFDIVYRRKRGGFSNFDIYAFGGVGMFMFNPQTTYDGETYNLKDYDTELNKPDYALMQLCVPMGVGMDFMLKSGWKVGIEYSYRVTFTDYIDDVSGYYSPSATTETIDGMLSDPGKGQHAISNGSPSTAGGQNSGTLRGDPTDNDGYMFTTITLSRDLSGIFGYKGYKSARHVRYKRGKKYKTGKGYRRKRR